MVWGLYQALFFDVRPFFGAADPARRRAILDAGSMKMVDSLRRESESTT
jgi:hypothetical protein